MKLTSGIISWVYIPLVMPVLALLFAMYVPAELDYTSFNSLYFIPNENKIYFLVYFAFYAFITPGISILILRAAKVIQSIELETSAERSVPLFLTAAYSAILLGFLIKLEQDVSVSKHLIGLALAGLVLSIVYGIVNFWTKISLHAGGAGMLVGFAVAYSMEQSLLMSWPLYCVIFIAGLIMMARIHLSKHSPQQAYMGFIIGSFITFITDYFSILYWV